MLPFLVSLKSLSSWLIPSLILSLLSISLAKVLVIPGWKPSPFWRSFKSLLPLPFLKLLSGVKFRKLKKKNFPQSFSKCLLVVLLFIFTHARTGTRLFSPLSIYLPLLTFSPLLNFRNLGLYNLVLYIMLKKCVLSWNEKKIQDNQTLSTSSS